MENLIFYALLIRG
jgi:hypothetical protein